VSGVKNRKKRAKKNRRKKRYRIGKRLLNRELETGDREIGGPFQKRKRRYERKE